MVWVLYSLAVAFYAFVLVATRNRRPGEDIQPESFLEDLAWSMNQKGRSDVAAVAVAAVFNSGGK